MVRMCLECCTYNNDDAIFCSNCGIQLSLIPPVPTELVQRYETLGRSVEELSDRNKILEEQLHKTTEEVRAVTGQLRVEESTSRMELERNLSQRNRALEEQLQKASADVKVLTTRIETNEQAQRMERSKTAELVEANRNLVQQVRRLRIRPQYCDRCGGRLMPTTNPNVLLCPACDFAWPTIAQPFPYLVTQASEGSASVEPAGEDYSHPGTMHAGRQ